MRLGYRKVKNGNNPSKFFTAVSSHPVMASKANKAMAQPYIEQYCADATLDTNQRREILQLATAHS